MIVVEENPCDYKGAYDWSYREEWNFLLFLPASSTPQINLLIVVPSITYLMF
jgi:hypothetical protein